MHKILFAALLMCSTAAWAADPAPAGDPPAAESGKMERKGGHAKWESMPFEEHKKKVLEMLAKRKAKLAESEACVNAAATKEALMACRPKRGEGGGHHKFGGKRGGGEGGGPGGGGEGPGGED